MEVVFTVLFSFANTNEGKGKETRSSLIGSVGGLSDKQSGWCILLDQQYIS
jgi:hypothetical protein